MHGLITLVPRLLENVSLEIECVYVSRLVCMLFFRRCMYVFACLPGFFARFQMLRVDHMCIFWRSRHTYEFDMFLATSAWPWRFTTCDFYFAGTSKIKEQLFKSMGRLSRLFWAAYRNCWKLFSGWEYERINWIGVVEVKVSPLCMFLDL